MSNTINLLYKDCYRINEKLGVRIPKVYEILDDEESYYSLVTSLTAMPVDLMVQLDDAGIDFSKINEYELFLILFNGIKNMDMSLILDGVDLSKFKMALSEQNGKAVLVDVENDIVIDRAIHNQISTVLRKIHNIEKDRRTPANEDSKKFMIERARKKLERQKKMARDSQLESLIISMVNTEQYKYDYEGTRELSIYQFNESVKQIINKVEYDNRMIGVYSGTISAKDLSQDELNWLCHKK